MQKFPFYAKIVIFFVFNTFEIYFWGKWGGGEFFPENVI